MHVLRFEKRDFRLLQSLLDSDIASIKVMQVVSDDLIADIFGQEQVLFVKMLVVLKQLFS
jgi:hypothetical protein